MEVSALCSRVSDGFAPGTIPRDRLCRVDWSGLIGGRKSTSPSPCIERDQPPSKLGKSNRPTGMEQWGPVHTVESRL